MKKAKINIEVTFREPVKGEEPNYLAYFEYKQMDYTCFAPDQKTMGLLLEGKSPAEGKVCKTVYERNGKRVNNVLS